MEAISMWFTVGQSHSLREENEDEDSKFDFLLSLETQWVIL